MAAAKINSTTAKSTASGLGDALDVDDTLTTEAVLGPSFTTVSGVLLRATPDVLSVSRLGAVPG